MELDKLKKTVFPEDKKERAECETRLVLWVFLFELGAALMAAAGGFLYGVILILILMIVPFIAAYIYRLISNKINKK